MFALKSDDHKIVQAGDGVEALNVAKTHQADLVIADANMPNIGDLTLVEELRALPNYKFKPILVLTTELSQEVKAKGLEAGASENHLVRIN